MAKKTRVRLKDIPPEELTPFARRVQRVLNEEFQGNASAMAKALGCQSSAISNWIRRGRTMEHQYAYKLQDDFKWEARWILEGVGDDRVPPPLTPGEATLLAKYREADDRRRDAAELILETP